MTPLDAERRRAGIERGRTYLMTAAVHGIAAAAFMWQAWWFQAGFSVVVGAAWFAHGLGTLRHYTTGDYAEGKR